MRQIGPAEPVDAFTALAEFLAKYGFKSVSGPTPQGVLLVHGQNVELNLRIWETNRIVGMINRERVRLTDSCATPMVIQVLLTVNRSTHRPLFVPLPADYTPEFLLENVLNAIRTLTYIHPEGAKMLEFGKLFPDRFPEAKRLSSPE